LDIKQFIGKIQYFSAFEWDLEFYGSTVNGLMTPGTSDIDITLTISKKGIEKIVSICHSKVI
jgi:hypothetical protein